MPWQDDWPTTTHWKQSWLILDTPTLAWIEQLLTLSDQSRRVLRRSHTARLQRGHNPPQEVMLTASSGGVKFLPHGSAALRFFGHAKFEDEDPGHPVPFSLLVKAEGHDEHHASIRFQLEADDSSGAA